MDDKVTSLRCLWWDRRRMTVELKSSGDGNPLSTDDPHWLITWEDGSSIQLQWLNYINANQMKYQARIHASTSGGRVYLQAEIKPENGNTKDVKGILIVDWEGKRWAAEVGKKSDGTPEFTMHSCDPVTPPGY